MNHPVRVHYRDRSAVRSVSGISGVPLSRQAYFAAGEFDTPEKIAQAWKAAMAGDPRTLIRISEDLENEPRIAGPLRTRRLAVSWDDMRIEPGAEGDDRAKEAAEYAEKWLARLDMDEVVRHLQGTAIRPFECLEILRDGFDVVGLKPWQASQFRFDYEKSGEQFRVLTEAAPDEGEVINPLQWVIKLSREKSHTLHARRGTIKGLAGRWLLMKYFYTFWAGFGERWGSPMVVGKYMAGTPDEKIRKLKSAVKSLGSDAAAIIEDTMVLEVMEAAKNSGRDVFSPAIDRFVADCAVQILGGTLTSMGSDQGAGSFSLGQVHDDVRDDLRDADGSSTANDITRQLILPQHRFVFGDSVPAPKLVYQKEVDADLQAELLISKGILDMGGELEIEKEYERFGRDVPDHLKGTMLKQATPSAQPFSFYSANANRRLQQAFRTGHRLPLTPP